MAFSISFRGSNFDFGGIVESIFSLQIFKERLVFSVGVPVSVQIQFEQNFALFVITFENCDGCLLILEVIYPAIEFTHLLITQPLAWRSSPILCVSCPNEPNNRVSAPCRKFSLQIFERRSEGISPVAGESF